MASGIALVARPSSLDRRDLSAQTCKELSENLRNMNM